ncbi:hypothetical protein BH10PLA2_BH10PLA2_38410 [soil metagenome]
MAVIRLGRAELERGRLPKVCMVCGDRASVRVKKTFAWYPVWAYLVGGIILAFLFTKRMTINAPLCNAHRNHWLLRTLIIVLGFVAAMVFSGILIFAVAIKSAANGPGDTPVMMAIGLAGALIVAWLVTTLVLQLTAIRATEITDKSMTLTNVSSSFISALRDFREERRNPDAEPVVRARKRKPQLEDDEDDESD